METVYKDSMCRCCASEGSFKDFTASYEWMGVEEVYADMLKDCFDITLSSPVPGNSNGGICEVCVTQLRNAFNFKKQVQNTEERFKKMQEVVFKPETIKIEIPNDDMDINSDNLDDDFSGPDYEVPIKFESSEEKPKKRTRASTSAARAKRAKPDGETSSKRPRPVRTRKEVVERHPLEEVRNFKPRSAEEKQRITIRHIFMHSNATVVESANDNGYLCYLCSELFENPATLKRHSLSKHHSKETCWEVENSSISIIKLDITDMTCTLCDTKINLLEDLFDHLMNAHGIESFLDEQTQIADLFLPFKCKEKQLLCVYCPQQFDTLQLLFSHMKTHTRKYVCDICNAHFVLDTSLCNHKEIHSSSLQENNTEKETQKYECYHCLDSFCDKESLTEHLSSHSNELICSKCNVKFTTQYHLIVHMKTKHGTTEKVRVNRNIPLEERQARTDAIRKLRENLFEVLLYSNATVIRARRDVGYICYFCPKDFELPADLKRHNIETYDEKQLREKIRKIPPGRLPLNMDVTDLTCKLCDSKIPMISDLYVHLKDVHHRPIHTDIEDFILPLKLNDNNLECPHCMQKFFKFKQLVTHIHSHYRNYVCDVCNQTFMSSRNFRVHIEIHKIGIFSCSYCDKVMDTKLKKARHERVYHGLWKGHDDTASRYTSRCKYCNEVFKYYHQKQKHLVEVHKVKLPSYDCKACDKVFPSRIKYRIHVEKDHLMEKSHVCGVCQRGFYTKRTLQNHMLTHTLERKYQCDICKKSFAKKYTLVQHLRIHANDRKFACKQCGQRFVQKCTLVGHVRAKHGRDGDVM